MSGAQSLSLREVADRAGVAMSSVSRVLSGHPDVSPAMRTRVMAVVQELGYEPNLLASSLRRGSTMTMAVVVGDISSPLASEIVLGAEGQLRGAGYAMLLASSHGSSDLEAAHIDRFRRRRVDGLVLSVCDESDPATLHQIERLQAPYVLIDREIPNARQASAVLCDHAAGVERVTEHLHGLAHRRVALVAGPVRVRPARELRGGFEAACARLGMQPVVETGELDAESGRDATMRVLARSPRPTAVICGSSRLLPGVLRAVAAHELRIPAGVSLVTFDELPMLEFVKPRIATVSRDPLAIGREAARLLLRRVRGEPPATIPVPTHFTAHESCGPAPA